MNLLDHLAAQVISVFEDSCGDEWLGQTIQCAMETGDGAYRLVHLERSKLPADKQLYIHVPWTIA